MWKKYEHAGEAFGIYNANGHLVVRFKERNATITPNADFFGVAANHELHRAPSIEEATKLACDLLLQANTSSAARRNRQCTKTEGFFNGLEVLQ